MQVDSTLQINLTLSLGTATEVVTVQSNTPVIEAESSSLGTVIELLMVVMIIGIILLDLAMQCIHISNQSRVYALIPGARNRLNTVYMTVSFMGTSLGSAIGLLVWDRAGWKGVCISGMLLAIAAFGVYAATYKKVRLGVKNLPA